MNEMKKIPCDKTIDNSLALLLEGYLFLQHRFERYHTDIFQTRLLGKKTICLTGEEAAKFFYNNNYFERKNAAPKRIQKTLMGQGGVQGLDSAAHQNRKQMFISIMTPDNMKRLIQYTWEQWEQSSKSWNNKEIVLFDEAQLILCQVACRWAGVPLQPEEVSLRASDLGKMIDGFGAVGLRYHQGRYARNRSEAWIRDIIRKIRYYAIKPAKGTAAHTIAWHLDQNKQLLTSQVAAVELLNIIRPIVAIATYITFGILAMFRYPDCRIKYLLQGDAYKQMFAQEVRRFYPFTPFVGAIVKQNVLWNQYYLPKGTMTLLDVYGINHDPNLWRKPYEFMPDRFKNWNNNPYSFMPQGGGDDKTGHRCAGEMVTLEVMKASLEFITGRLSYKIKRQNLSYRMCRIPTLPKSRMVLSNVRRNVK